MAKQTINIGLVDNDNTGDTLRGGATKINQNFTELYDMVNAIPIYTLPAASATVLGGVRVDDTTIKSTNGIISVYNSAVPATATPLSNGVAAVGTSTKYAREDHIHPTDTQTGSLFPAGGIIMWSGSTAPAGWALCDGTQGTPDLRNKFIVGYSTTYPMSSTGGRRDAIIPSHTHNATSTFAGTALDSHTHTISDPGHTHSINGGSSSTYQSGGGYGASTGHNTTAAAVTLSATTGIGINGASAGTPTGTVSTTIDSTGTTVTDSNLPPYYALAFIMKL